MTTPNRTTPTHAPTAAPTATTPPPPADTLSNELHRLAVEITHLGIRVADLQHAFAVLALDAKPLEESSRLVVSDVRPSFVYVSAEHVSAIETRLAETVAEIAILEKAVAERLAAVRLQSAKMLKSELAALGV